MQFSRHWYLFLLSYCTIVRKSRAPKLLANTGGTSVRPTMTTSATWPVDHELDDIVAGSYSTTYFVAAVVSPVSDSCRMDFTRVTVRDVCLV